MRRAVLSVLRYLLRGTSRATPFGLLAGVAPARIGPRAAIRAGTRHRAVARADATWLTSVIEALEADDELLPRLTVVASDLVAERDGHLVIGHRSSGSPGSAPERVQVRATRPVRAALDAARSPIRVADLAAKLAADFPAATSDVIGGLIARLISLAVPDHQPARPDDRTRPARRPARRTGRRRAARRCQGEPRLRAVSASLARHNTAPDAGHRS